MSVQHTHIHNNKGGVRVCPVCVPERVIRFQSNAVTVNVYVRVCVCACACLHVRVHGHFVCVCVRAGVCCVCVCVCVQRKGAFADVWCVACAVCSMANWSASDESYHQSVCVCVCVCVCVRVCVGEREARMHTIHAVCAVWTPSVVFCDLRICNE